MQNTAYTCKSNAIKAWITQHPALSFYLLTLTLSWGYWFTLPAQGQHVAPDSAATHFPGLLGPMFAAIVVTAVTGGRKALHELFARMCDAHRPAQRDVSPACVTNIKRTFKS